MILVDTSVLIDYLRGVSTPSVEKFQGILDGGVRFGITPLIYQEVLQGAATAADFDRLKAYLETQVCYELKHGRDSYARAARLYFDCRRAGFTLTSTIDCLVAETALEHDLQLLHNDQDYDHIQKVNGKLQFL